MKPPGKIGPGFESRVVTFNTDFFRFSFYFLFSLPFFSGGGGHPIKLLLSPRGPLVHYMRVTYIHHTITAIDLQLGAAVKVPMCRTQHDKSCSDAFRQKFHACIDMVFVTFEYLKFANMDRKVVI